MNLIGQWERGVSKSDWSTYLSIPCKLFESRAPVNFDLTRSLSLCSYSLSRAKELLTVLLPGGQSTKVKGETLSLTMT